MAIYYINPHTTTNGTGTYASPWSFNSATRTGLAAGDEIRIMGVALTSLLTATSYTATVTSQYQLTITAGGGLGADWAVNDIGYLPAYDTFFRVYAVSTNVISGYTTTSLLPIYNWSTTSLTVRRVDIATYPASTTASPAYFGTPVNNLTITDCWTSATTRVTDGTVKSLINYGASSATLNLQTVATTLVSGLSADCPNTAAVAYGVSSTSAGWIYLVNYASSSTITFGQIYGWGSGGLSTLTNGSTTNPVSNTTINITHLAAFYPIGSNTLNGTNITINITHATYSNIDYLVSSPGNSTCGINGTNNTINITNIHCFSSGSVTAPLVLDAASNFTYSLTGTVDMYSNLSLTAICAGYMSATVTIGPSVIYYYNKRVSTLSTVANLISHNYTPTITNTTAYLPDVTVNNGWTVSNKSVWTVSMIPYASQTATLPSEFTLSVGKSSDITSGYPYVASGTNTIVMFRNGDAPYEVLGVLNAGASSALTASYLPQITTDATVYRTTGPSLKSYLASRQTSLWGNSTQRIARAFKTIKVPCVSGTSYTISGYTRTDDAAYVNGDLRVAVYLNNVEITGQDMTTASYNAWESFTLTFTAAQTAEYIFAMKMYYETGAKSYWLDDFTIA